MPDRHTPTDTPPDSPPSTPTVFDHELHWPAWYRRFVVGWLFLSVALLAGDLLLDSGLTPPLWRAVSILVVPAAITVAVLASGGRRTHFALVAALLLDLEGVMAALFFAVGLAYAILLPVIGVALVMGVARGRMLTFAFVTSGGSAIVGFLAADLVGPPSRLPKIGMPAITLTVGVLFIAYCFIHLRVIIWQRGHALDAASADLTSRRAAETTLSRTSQLLAAIVGSSPLPTAVFDSDRSVLLWNPASERTLGWTSAEVVGNQPPPGLTPPDEVGPTAERHERIVAGGTTHGERARRVTKDGREIWVEVHSAPLDNGDGSPIGVVSQLVDVTRQVALETRLVKLAQMERTLAEAGAAFLSMNADGEVYEGLCRAAMQIGGLRMAWVGLREPGSHLIRPQAWRGEENGYLAEAGVLEATGPDGGLVSSALRTAAPLALDDLAADPGIPTYAIAVRHGYRSAAAIPLLSGSVVVGVLECFADKPGVFLEQEVSALRRLARDADMRLAALGRESARREAQLALTLSEERYRGLFETAPVGIIVMRRGGAEVNDTLVAMFGYLDRESLLAAGLMSIVADEGGDDVELIRRSLQPGNPVPTLLRTTGRRMDGSTFPVLVEGTQVELDGSNSGIVFLTDLSAMGAAEDAAFAMRAQYRSLVQSAPLAVISLDLEGMVRSWNPAAERIYGWSAAEVIGRVAPGGVTVSGLAELARIAASGEPSAAMETTRKRRDGSAINVRLWISPIQDPTGRPIGTLLIVEDVTNERRMTLENARLATAINETADTVVITDLRARITFVNPAFERVTGYSRDEAMGKNPRILKSGRHEVPFYDSMWATLLAGETWTGELVNRRKDGTEYTEEASISPIRDATGEATGYVAVKRDVTALRRAAADQRETERRYRSLFANMHEILISCEAVYENGLPVDFIFLDVNAAFEAQLGLSGVAGKRFSEVMPRFIKTTPDLFAAFTRVADGGPAEYLETHVDSPDAWFAISAYSAGTGRFVVLADEISGRVRAEQEARRSYELQARAESVAHVGSWRFHLETSKTVWSSQVFEILGIESNGKPSVELLERAVHPADLAAYRAATAGSLTDAVPPAMEFRIVRPDGGVRWIYGAGERELDAAGRVVAFVGYLQDITERKQADAALEESRVLLDSIVDSTTDLVWSVDPETFGLTSFNRGLSEYFGSSRGMHIELGMRPEELFPAAEFADLWRGFYGRALAEGSFETEYEVFAATRVLELKLHALERNGTAFGISVFGRDVTETRRRQRTLAARLRLAEFSLTHELDQLLEEALNEAERLTGSVIGFYHFVDDDQEHLSLQVWSTRTKSEFCTAEGSAQHYAVADAGVWVDCVRERQPVIHNDYAALPGRRGMPEGHAWLGRELVVPVLRNGKVTAILGVGNKATDYTEADIEAVVLLGDLSFDIAERKRAEAALRFSEARYRTVLEEAPIAIGAHRGGKGLFGNEAHRRMFGYEDPAALTRLSADDMVAPQSRATVEERVRRREAGLPVDTEYEMLGLRRDGSTFAMLVRATPMELPDGPATLLFHVDLTDLRRADAALRASEEKFASAFHAAPVWISITDLVSGAYIDVNEEVLQASGFDRDEMVGHTAVEIGWISREDSDRFRAEFDAHGRIDGMEAEFHTKDGRAILGHLRAEIVPLFGRDCLLTATIDVTDRRLAEADRERLQARPRSTS
jgi:PAS domain S-box-containing protein